MTPWPAAREREKKKNRKKRESNIGESSRRWLSKNVYTVHVFAMSRLENVVAPIDFYVFPFLSPMTKKYIQCRHVCVITRTCLTILEVHDEELVVSLAAHTLLDAPASCLLDKERIVVGNPCGSYNGRIRSLEQSRGGAVGNWVFRSNVTRHTIIPTRQLACQHEHAYMIAARV